MPRFMGFVRTEQGAGQPPQALYEAIGAYVGEQFAIGHFLDGGALSGVADAVNFVLRDGQMMRVDGPYAETEPAVTGWSITKYDSLEEAVAGQQEFAELHLKHWPEGSAISTLRQIPDDDPAS